MPFVGTLTIYNKTHKTQIMEDPFMFEVIIGCTFVLWCVFGGILVKVEG